MKSPALLGEPCATKSCAPERPTQKIGNNPALALALGIWHTAAPVANPTEAVQCRPLEVQVGEKGIERAIKHLKRKMAAEGTLRELKRRRHYMKPSVKSRKKIAEAARRRRKRIKPEESRF